MELSNGWQTTCNRFVAYLDIMGFKEMVASNEHSTIYNRMFELSKLVFNVNNPLESEKYKNKSVYTINFSDSIFVFSNDDTHDAFELFLMSTSYIFGGCIEKSFAIKGGLAYGTISVNKISQIFFGQPIIDAFLLQDELNYYGIIGHHSLERYYLDLINNKVANDLLFNIKTPLKTGFVEHLNLDWSYGYNFVTKGKEPKFSIFEKIDSFKKQTSGGTRKYIDNTKDVYLQRLQTK